MSITHCGLAPPRGRRRGSWAWRLLDVIGFLVVTGGNGELLGADSSNCCLPPYSFFDCTGKGHAVSPGKLYTCVNVASLTGCMTCLSTTEASGTACTSCCTVEADSECATLESDWEFYASSLFFVCLCCCFSVLCGFTEMRRKKKGISFAEAWSVPHAMPILRTWPERSLSASDMLPEGTGGEERQHWSPLSDDEEDLKNYPVAGLVDDSGMAFGFVTSLPQTLRGTVATALRHAQSARNSPPPPPQEPEVTVWVSREGEVEAAVGQGGVEGAVVDARGARDERTRRGRGSQLDGGARVVVVGNDLQEPLIFGDDAGVPGRTTVEGGSSGERRGGQSLA